MADKDTFVMQEAGSAGKVEHRTLVPTAQSANEFPSFDESKDVTLKSFVAFSVHRTAPQSITNGTTQKVQFTAEAFDTHSYFDSATNYEFKPTANAGKYFISATIRFIGIAASGAVFVYLYKNGAEYKQARGYSVSGSSESISIADVVDLAVNDTLDIRVSHADGAPLDIGAAVATQVFFSGFRVAT